jgi:benzoate membrane transport protein
MIASWMWALGIGMGLCTLIPSLWLKKPVMVAWSTPAAAVLASAGAARWTQLTDAEFRLTKTPFIHWPLAR